MAVSFRLRTQKVAGKAPLYVRIQEADLKVNLMYLAGMDYYDIMRITGHTSPTMLKKYIKADSIDVADKITDKYSYFD